MPALIDFRSIVAAFSKPIQGKNLAVESGARPTARIDDLDNTAMEKNHPLQDTGTGADTDTGTDTDTDTGTDTCATAAAAEPGFPANYPANYPANSSPKGSILPTKDAGPNTIAPGQQIKNKPVAQIQDIDPDAELAPHSQSSTMNVVSRSVTQVVIHSKEKTAFVVDEDNDSDSTVERAKKVDKTDKADKEDSTSSGPQLDRLGANDNGASSLLSGREWKLATALLLIASCYRGLNLLA
ncbi:hypothetical protein DL89DRAFT_268152 [Linderina pennispora]|uniref:Uncharacterized protein n=1 Tax=Linderina pennispora TaxID=61395 RepID=A0A1Y1W7C0_9FUNG|nr:uncharacterized protein DL89DRAFT_268152 [Linderina pennispora]ORX69136.1 hypothetical protein DL89DRAFT_268152 [Linderina pennispora]